LIFWKTVMPREK